MAADDTPRNKAMWRAWAAEHRPGVAIDHGAVVAGLRAFLAPVRGRILSYRPLRDEVDLDALLDDPRMCLTRTHSGGLLTVHEAHGPMERHRFGFLQPVAGAPEVPLDDLGAVLVPGMVFDIHGGRIGHGAGYYDRLLARVSPAVPRVGVTARAFLVAVRLSSEDHDVPMTHLATEQGVRGAQP